MRQSILFVILALGGLFMAYGAATYCPDSIVSAKAFTCSTTAIATNTANVLTGATALPFVSATQAAATFYATVTLGADCTTTGAALADIIHIMTVQTTVSAAAVNLIDVPFATQAITLRGVTADTSLSAATATAALAAGDTFQIIASADLAGNTLWGALGTNAGTTAGTAVSTATIPAGYTSSHKFDTTTKIVFCADTGFTKFAACTVSLRVEKTAKTTTIVKGLLYNLNGESSLIAQYLFKEKTGTSVANQISTTTHASALGAATFGDTAKTAATLPTWPTSDAGVLLTATSYVKIPTVTPVKDPILNTESLQVTFWIKQETLAAGTLWQLFATDGTTSKAKISIDTAGVITATIGTANPVTGTGTAIVAKTWTLVSVYLSSKIVVVNVGQTPTTWTGTQAVTAATITFATSDLQYLGASAGAAVAHLQDVRVYTPGSLTWNTPSCSAATCLVSLGVTPQANCLATSVCPSQTTGTVATACTYTPSSFINTDLSVLQIIAISLAGVGLAGLIA